MFGSGAEDKSFDNSDNENDEDLDRNYDSLTPVNIQIENQKESMMPEQLEASVEASPTALPEQLDAPVEASPTVLPEQQDDSVEASPTALPQKQDDDALSSDLSIKLAQEQVTQESNLPRLDTPIKPEVEVKSPKSGVLWVDRVKES